MKNKKNIRNSIFISSVVLSIFLVLLASSMQVAASPDAFDSVALQNGTGIGGSSTGSTGTLRISPIVTGPKNFSIRAIYYNTSATTWAMATLAGVAGNTSCASDACNHTTTVRGAMAITFTLPSDVTRTHLRVLANSTAGGSVYVNESVVLTIDSTGPTFTLYPASGFLQITSNKTVNMTVVTNENVSSIWIYMSNIGKNFSNTLDVAGTNALTRTGDTRWAFSQQLSSDQLVSYYARAYDYAVDGGNGATSSVRTFQLNTGLSPGARFATNEQAVTTDRNRTLLIFGAIALAAYLLMRRK